MSVIICNNVQIGLSYSIYGYLKFNLFLKWAWMYKTNLVVRLAPNIIFSVITELT